MNDPQSQADILLDARQLWREYDGHVAVRELDLVLRRGDVLGFLGPNGAGKSTTMQMLSGNLAPTSGSIRIGGIDLLEDPAAAKRQLGYLPEQPPLYPELTVGEYLDFCARLHGLAAADRTKGIDRALDRCGLGDSRCHLIGQLSKGYQQRVGIAQAILHDPAVVILDEPTVGLDPIQIREIRALVRELGEAHAVILSTHILPEVQETCNRVLVINRGRGVHADALGTLNDDDRHYRLVAARLPADADILDIPGIAGVQRNDSQTVTVRVEGDAAVVLAAAVRADWGVSEFAPQHRNLEQLFVELTARDLDENPGRAGEEDAA